MKKILSGVSQTLVLFPLSLSHTCCAIGNNTKSNILLRDEHCVILRIFKDWKDCIMGLVLHKWTAHYHISGLVNRNFDKSWYWALTYWQRQENDHTWVGCLADSYQILAKTGKVRNCAQCLGKTIAFQSNPSRILQAPPSTRCSFTHGPCIIIIIIFLDFSNFTVACSLKLCVLFMI